MWRVVSWILAIVVALIFIQSLFFKFTGAEESIALFTAVKATMIQDFGLTFLEPWSESFLRYGVGVAELLAAILIIMPQMRRFGAILGFLILTGALYFHILGPLASVLDTAEQIAAAPGGIELFYMAVGAWVASLILVFVGNGVRD